jgi:PAS domain S-box-containing protein
MPSQRVNFESLLENVPDALVGVDLGGAIRYVNRQTELLFGYDRDDLLGTPLESLVPQSLREVHTALQEGYTAAPRSRSMGTDLRLSARRSDGTHFPVDISLSQADSTDGMLVIAAVRDMTGYRSAQVERRRLDRLLAIVEYSDHAIIATTLDGTITSWNPAAEKTFGYSSAEIIGRSDSLITPEDRTGETRDILARITRDQHVDHLESIRVRKDGTAVSVSLSVSPISDADDAIVGACTIARDVTEARRAFEAARSMIEASLDSLVSIGPDGKITDANEATVKLTGVPRDKLIGTSFSDYFTDPKKAEAIYQRVFTEGMAVDYPLTLRHRDGHETLTEVLYNASVYRDDNGNVLGVFAAARDVTNQMQTQRRIAEQQARELARLAQLERFQQLTVGRELKMIELKKEIEYLRMLGNADRGESGDKG